MKKLCDLPNIGKKLAEKLSLIGINEPKMLLEKGSKDTFLKLKIIDSDVCINTLYAIEGAIQGIRWHGLSKEVKIDLLSFFNEVK